LHVIYLKAKIFIKINSKKNERGNKTQIFNILKDFTRFGALMAIPNNMRAFLVFTDALLKDGSPAPQVVLLMLHELMIIPTCW